MALADPPVLLVHGDARVAAMLQRALAALDRHYPLMVVAQPVEVRQYLLDACDASRSPALIVLNVRDTDAVPLISWLDAQRHPLPEIPIIGIGPRPSLPHFYRLDASIPEPTPESLAHALRGALESKPPEGKSLQ